MERLLLEDGQAEREGGAARAWVCERFKWAERLQELEGILLGPRVLEARSAPAEEVLVGRRPVVEVGV